MKNLLLKDVDSVDDCNRVRTNPYDKVFYCCQRVWLLPQHLCCMY